MSGNELTISRFEAINGHVREIVKLENTANPSAVAQAAAVHFCDLLLRRAEGNAVEKWKAPTCDSRNETRLDSMVGKNTHAVNILTNDYEYTARKN